MTKKTVALLSVILSLLLVAAPLISVSAADSPFDDDAYASVLTGSDFQDLGTKAYDRFGRLLTKMKEDGLETPDSLLVGGDYTKILFDYAAPGITQIRTQLTTVYPDADPDSVVCIQGNHDNPTAGFVKTGFYDMGVYCLYVINEDDFTWLQAYRPGYECHVKKVAADLEESLNSMIEDGDLRPVIVLTHLPLHHTERALYGDNKYASYYFNVLNEAGKTLDVIFLFGHQHSDDYDDYIGGSVNFMAAGDVIRVPKPDTQGADFYTEETLTFTYANCGYVGYSNNTESETSTNVLTLGVIRFSENAFRFVKYTEDGLYKSWDVQRKNPGVAKDRAGTPAQMNEAVWKLELDFFTRFFEIFGELLRKLSMMFG